MINEWNYCSCCVHMFPWVFPVARHVFHNASNEQAISVSTCNTTAKLRLGQHRFVVFFSLFFTQSLLLLVPRSYSFPTRLNKVIAFPPPPPPSSLPLPLPPPPSLFPARTLPPPLFFFFLTFHSWRIAHLLSLKEAVRQAPSHFPNPVWRQSALCSTVSVFHRVFTPTRVCSTTDRSVLQPMFHRVFSPPCLCFTVCMFQG